MLKNGAVCVPQVLDGIRGIPLGLIVFFHVKTLICSSEDVRDGPLWTIAPEFTRCVLFLLTKGK